MNDVVNEDVIEKVVIKNVAIYKAMSELSLPFEDKFVNKENICQQNEIIQSQNLEKCLNEIEPNKENEIIDTTNETKNDLEKKSWKDITDPKLRLKAYKKVWRKVNINKVRNSKKKYRENNRDKINSYKKNYYKSNKESINIKNKEWYKANKDRVNSHIKNKKKTDIQYKLSHNLRNRLGEAIKNNQKVGSAVKDLGCSIEELKTYLESKFLPGMNWDNWRRDGWHIDHIKPLASFDLTDRKQLLEACHYTNLQPLWAKDNISKGDDII